MGIKIGDNFDYSAREFLDSRSSCRSLDELERSAYLYPKGFEVYCEKEGMWYINVGGEGCCTCDCCDHHHSANCDCAPKWEPRNLPGVDLKDYATVDFVKRYVSSIEIPEVDGEIATEEFVRKEIENIEFPEPDLSNYPTFGNVSGMLADYANKEFVEDAIAGIEIPEVDLTGYATINFVRDSVHGLVSEEDIHEIIAGLDISNSLDEEAIKKLIKEEMEADIELYVEGYLDGLDLPSKCAIKNFVEDYVAEAIANAQLSGGEVDLSGLRAEIEEKLAGKADVGHSHSYNELADLPEIPSIEGLATEDFVREQIEAIEHPQFDDSELRDMIEAIEIPSIEGLATEDFVREQIEGIEMPEVPEVNLEGMATEVFVQEAIAAIEHPQYDDSEIRALLDKIIGVLDQAPIYEEPTLELNIVTETVPLKGDEEVTLNIIFDQKDAGEVTGFKVMRDGVEIHSSAVIENIVDRVPDDVATVLEYTAIVKYAEGPVKESVFGIAHPEGVIKAGSVSAKDSVEVEGTMVTIYYGIVGADVEAMDAEIMATLESMEVEGRENKLEFSDMEDERIVYMYPSSLGELDSVKDGNNFENLGSYMLNKFEHEGIEYNVYILAEPIFIDATDKAIQFYI